MLLSKTVLMKWHPKNRSWYEEKGYKFTKYKDEFEVKVEDLSKGSNVKIQIECDICGKEIKIKYQHYNKCVKDDEKYYCQKCALKTYINESVRKTKLEKGLSFQQWCCDNLSKKEAEEVLLRWDYNLNNGLKPNDIGFSTHKKCWFKCLKHPEHGSELKNINSFTNGRKEALNCNQCNSFEQWCYDNLLKEEANDVLSRWDYEKNIDKDGNVIKPSNINYSSNGFNKKGYYFKCPRELHESELKSINYFTTSKEATINVFNCSICNSFGQYLLDNYGENAINEYWNKENLISPFLVCKSSNTKFKINCVDKKYHGFYTISLCDFTKGRRCSYCYKRQIHPLDSLGQYIIDNYGEDFLDKVWSDKNKKSAFEYAPNSNQLAWWKCTNNEHEDYKRSINSSNVHNFRCPECQFSKGEKRVEDYLINNNFTQNIDYIPQKEFEKLVGLGNGNLSYDFYLPNHNLLIEYQGGQHEQYIKGFHKSKKDFEKQQEHDRRKKQYAIDNNIKLLEIWYWDYDNVEEILEKELKRNDNNNLKNVI